MPYEGGLAGAAHRAGNSGLRRRQGSSSQQSMGSMFEILCEDAQFTPIAEHVMTTHTRTLGREHELVSHAQPGDAYRLLVVIGLGGGHSLTVKDFTLLIELDTNHLELGSAVSNDSFHELSRTQGSA